MNKRSKFILILTALSVSLLFIIGFIQTNILKSKQNYLSSLENTNTELSQQRTEAESEANYISSDEYKDEYKKHNTTIDKNSTDKNADNETISVVIK